MRKAEEWYNDYREELSGLQQLNVGYPISQKQVKEMFAHILNLARKEVIVEAAKRAKVIVEAGNGYAHVDYKSILSLINELK